MRHPRRILQVCFLVSISLLLSSYTSGGEFPLNRWKAWNEHSAEQWPNPKWQAYTSAEEAGWSSGGLDRARAYYESLDSAAVMVIYDGAVLAAWGDVERRFPCHSIRKSLLSALYGIHVAEGTIDLNKTLAELNIDDRPPLSALEKSARVVDLLKSRSAVYHAAAYETDKMKKTRPPRDSRRPGAVFWYNNWDFNALGTIFEQETGAKIFQQFRVRFAVPLNMEDFRIQDTYYHLEPEHSVHPAYPFRMSARDLARFGLLFLRQGRWRNKQILSSQWVADSTRSYFNKQDASGNSQYGYGYLWWRILEGPFKDVGMYSARGYGGHAVDVVPLARLVLVHRVDTFWDLSLPLDREKHRVETSERFKLLNLILQARTGPPKSPPRLVALPQSAPSSDEFAIGPGAMERYSGVYQFDSFSLHVKLANGKMLMGNDRVGEFTLLPRSATRFTTEDLDMPVCFELDDGGQATGMTIETASGKKLSGRRIIDRD